MSASDSMTVAAALSNSGSTISRSMAKSLGSNIAEGTPLDNIAAIASAVPLSCFSSTSPAQLANLVGTMDLENMTPLKKGFIASKVIKNLALTLIKRLIMNLCIMTGSCIWKCVSNCNSIVFNYRLFNCKCNTCC
jgi:hypothetical protein